MKRNAWKWCEVYAFALRHLSGSPPPQGWKWSLKFTHGQLQVQWLRLYSMLVRLLREPCEDETCAASSCRAPLKSAKERMIPLGRAVLPPSKFWKSAFVGLDCLPHSPLQQELKSSLDRVIRPSPPSNHRYRPTIIITTTFPSLLSSSLLLTSDT